MTSDMSLTCLDLPLTCTDPALPWSSPAAVVHNFCVVRGAIRLHNRMVASLVRCKMSFFDSTPSGRIINRLSKDIDSGTNTAGQSSADCSVESSFFKSSFMIVDFQY